MRFNVQHYPKPARVSRADTSKPKRNRRPRVSTRIVPVADRIETSNDFRRQIAADAAAW